MQLTEKTQALFGSVRSAYATRAVELDQIDDGYTIDARHMHQTDGEYDPFTSGVADLHVVEPQRFDSISDHDKISIESTFVPITRNDRPARTKGKVIPGRPHHRSSSCRRAIFAGSSSASLRARGHQSSMFAGTFPPCAASSFITRLCNQIFIAAESAVSPA